MSFFLVVVMGIYNKALLIVVCVDTVFKKCLLLVRNVYSGFGAGRVVTRM